MGGDCPALLCAGAASPQVLGADLATTAQEVSKAVTEHPKESMRMVKGLEEKQWEQWLRALGLVSMEKRILRAELIVGCTFLRRGSRGAGSEAGAVPGQV